MTLTIGPLTKFGLLFPVVCFVFVSGCRSSLEKLQTWRYLLFSTLFLLVNWSVKANRRKTTGTGRMRHLKKVYRRFRNGFQEGKQAKSLKRKAPAAQPASN